MASCEGAGKLKEGEHDDQENRKEGEGMPDTRVWVGRNRAGCASIRGGLTSAAPQRHYNETNIKKS